MERIIKFTKAYHEELKGISQFEVIETGIEQLQNVSKDEPQRLDIEWKTIMLGLLTLAADKDLRREIRQEAFEIAGKASREFRDETYKLAERAKLQGFIGSLKKGDVFYYNGMAQMAPDTENDRAYFIEHAEAFVFDGEYKNVREDYEDNEELPIQRYPLRFQTANRSNAIVAISTEQAINNMVSVGLNIYELLDVSPDATVGEECDCKNCRARRAADQNEETHENIFAKTAASLERGEVEEAQKELEATIRGAIKKATGRHSVSEEVEVSVKRVKKTKAGKTKVDVVLN